MGLGRIYPLSLHVDASMQHLWIAPQITLRYRALSKCFSLRARLP